MNSSTTSSVLNSKGFLLPSEHGLLFYKSIRSAIIGQEILLACLGTQKLFKIAFDQLCSETEFRGQLSIRFYLHKGLPYLVQHLTAHRDTGTKKPHQTKNQQQTCLIH